MPTPAQIRHALYRDALMDAKDSMFSRQLAAGPTIPTVVKRLVHTTYRLVKTGTSLSSPSSPTRNVQISANIPKGKGFNPAGFYYGIVIDFALGPQSSNTPNPELDSEVYHDTWGQAFSTQITMPAGGQKDTIYCVRATLSQLKVEPLVGGFVLRWHKPANWTWADNQPNDVPVQVASNPLVLTRLAKSPSGTFKSSRFNCDVLAQYP